MDLRVSVLNQTERPARISNYLFQIKPGMVSAGSVLERHGTNATVQICQQCNFAGRDGQAYVRHL